MSTAMTTSVLMVTANVGSIFEDPEVLLKIWTKEFLDTVSRLEPHFIALHCQEVGGKNFEQSMRHVEDFVRTLLASEQLGPYPHVRVFLDEDCSDADQFTALGSLYLIHESLPDVSIWDFTDHIFIPVSGKEIHSGNIESVSVKEKSKFAQNLFPECKWSRKGYLRTRWRITGHELDLINIHLFHDASNFVSNSEFPSVYAQNRFRAFDYTLRRIENDKSFPLFIFGDFNFRLDTRALIRKLTNGTEPEVEKCTKSDEIEKMVFKDKEQNKRVVLTLEKKGFEFENKDFFGQNNQWLRAFDRELDAFRDRLIEFDISFPPSYPFREDASGADQYMTTRCPAWCDRIVFNRSADKIILKNPNDSRTRVQYAMMGRKSPMGDHKPIYLCFHLVPLKGNDSNALNTAWHDRHELHDPDPNDVTPVPLYPANRVRTQSNPSISAVSNAHKSARRSTSAFTAEIHSHDWHRKTEELFRSLRDKRVDSSRLMSHHSSSDEDWYSGIGDNIEDSVENSVGQNLSEVHSAGSSHSVHESGHKRKHCLCLIS